MMLTESRGLFGGGVAPLAPLFAPSALSSVAFREDHVPWMSRPLLWIQEAFTFGTVLLVTSGVNAFLIFPSPLPNSDPDPYLVRLCVGDPGQCLLSDVGLTVSREGKPWKWIVCWLLFLSSELLRDRITPESAPFPSPPCNPDSSELNTLSML